MLKNGICAAGLFMIMSSPALAEDGGLYVSVQAGVRAVEQQSAQAAAVMIDGELDNGLYLSGAVGYKFKSDGTGFRVESELAWRGGNLNHLDVNGVPVAVTGDGFSALSFMGNGYVDFNNRSAFTPYLGAGIGMARIKGDIDAGANSLDDTATVIAVQAIGGVDLAVTDGISVFADLRYFKALDTTMTLNGSTGTGDIEVDYDAYTVGLGVRMQF
tara:strand:- start:645 stop:1289 length:645 start_codon:yes stop_codon:yes gene_type:complete